MYKLKFESPRNYAICIQSITMNQKVIPVIEWDNLVSMVRKLKSIGTPSMIQPNRESPTIYDLADSGTEISLTSGEYKLLLDLLQQPIWKTSVIEDIVSVRDWLRGIKEEKNA